MNAKEMRGQFMAELEKFANRKDNKKYSVMFAEGTVIKSSNYYKLKNLPIGKHLPTGDVYIKLMPLTESLKPELGDHCLKCELRFKHDRNKNRELVKEFYDFLYRKNRKHALSQELFTWLIFEENPNWSEINAVIPVDNIWNKEPSVQHYYFIWFCETALRFQKFFSKYYDEDFTRYKNRKQRKK